MFVNSHTLRVWELDVENRKIRPTDVNMGQVKRIVKCIEMLEDDKFFYCGTTTGDIIAINTQTRLFQVIKYHISSIDASDVNLKRH